MDLYKLKSLTLDNNPKIKVIPDTLKKLKKLTYLSLKSNSI
jgi:Leucine-rich repeat (LRR) protein